MSKEIEGIELITLVQLKEIYKCNKLTMKQAMPIMREFRDTHGLTDKQALNAFGISKKIFEI